MWEMLLFAFVGLCFGVVRAIITGKGLIALPRIETKNEHKFLNLGVVAPMIIGAAAGWLAPYSLGVDAAVAAMAGYTGVDFIENAIERLKKLP